MFRNDTSDISDCELQNITDKEIILKEYDNNNTMLQDKEKLVNTFSLLLFTGLSILGWSFLKNELVLSNLSSPFILILSFIFIFQGLLIHISRGKLIKRKNLIIMYLNKCEDKVKKGN